MGKKVKIGELTGVRPVYRRKSGEICTIINPEDYIQVEFTKDKDSCDGLTGVALPEPFDPNEVVMLLRDGKPPPPVPLHKRNGKVKRDK